MWRKTKWGPRRTMFLLLKYFSKGKYCFMRRHKHIECISPLPSVLGCFEGEDYIRKENHRCQELGCTSPDRAPWGVRQCSPQCPFPVPGPCPALRWPSRHASLALCAWHRNLHCHQEQERGCCLLLHYFTASFWVHTTWDRHRWFNSCHREY